MVPIRAHLLGTWLFYEREVILPLTFYGSVQRMGRLIPIWYRVAGIFIDVKDFRFVGGAVARFVCATCMRNCVL
jgi:hypothetical protein